MFSQTTERHIKHMTICKKCIPILRKKLESAIESQLHSYIEKKLECVETALTKAIESQLHSHIEKS